MIFHYNSELSSYFLLPVPISFFLKLGSPIFVVLSFVLDVSLFSFLPCKLQTARLSFLPRGTVSSNAFGYPSSFNLDESLDGSTTYENDLLLLG